eukprot:1913771-Prymnesium_polylepis.2
MAEEWARREKSIRQEEAETLDQARTYRRTCHRPLPRPPPHLATPTLDVCAPCHAHAGCVRTCFHAGGRARAVADGGGALPHRRRPRACAPSRPALRTRARARRQPPHHSVPSAREPPP